MLARHMFGYMPSLVITGLVAFTSVFCFTHLLPPEAYGHYVLAINTMTLLVGVGFIWLQSAASRLLPQEVENGNAATFTATLYVLYALCCLGLMIGAVLVLVFFPTGDWRLAAWCAPPLAMLRALLNINQALHRNYTQIARYNVVEIGQSVLGLGAALVLIVLLKSGATGAAVGLMMGLAAMAIFDWRMLAVIRRENFNLAMLHEIFHFGLPFIINYALTFVLSRSDSFLLQIYRGAAEVGIYNAGYAFPDRIGQYLFMAVATASLPLTVKCLEKQGVEAARAQTYINGIAVLALAVPACIGLLFATPQIVAVLIGPDYRSGALLIMPWITVAMLFNGLAIHYFDHALHLAKRTQLFFFTLGPAALANFIANLFIIPRYGAIGAAWTTLGTYVLYFVLSILIGRQAFRIRFPFIPALQIAASTAVMALILWTGDFSLSLWGLLHQIIIGAVVYALGLLTFNVMGVRVMVGQMWRARFALPTVGNQTYDVLKSDSAIEAIAEEWRALHARAGAGPFTRYDWHHIWWQEIGRHSSKKRAVLIAREVSGLLSAVMPLEIELDHGARVARWAGQDMFDYGDVVTADASLIPGLLAYAERLRLWDVLLLKDVHEKAKVRAALRASTRLREEKNNHVLPLECGSGEAWLALQSRKMRGSLRRKTEKLEEKFEVVFNVSKGLDATGLDILRTLHTQKTVWLKTHHHPSHFADACTLPFLWALATDAAARGELYLGWLSYGGEIIACNMGFVCGDALLFYQTSYDTTYAEYSVGNLLMVRTIMWAVDRGLREVDFLRGNENYKERFAGEQRVLSTYIQGRTWLGRLAVLFKSHSKSETVNAPE